MAGCLKKEIPSLGEHTKMTMILQYKKKPMTKILLMEIWELGISPDSETQRKSSMRIRINISSSLLYKCVAVTQCIKLKSL